MAESHFQVLEKIEENLESIVERAFVEFNNQRKQMIKEMLAEVKKNQEQWQEQLMFGISEEFKVLESSISSDLETKSDDEFDFGGLETEIPFSVAPDKGSQTQQEEVLLTLSSESQKLKLTFGEYVQGQWEEIIWSHNLSPPVFDTGQFNSQIDKELDLGIPLQPYIVEIPTLIDSNNRCIDVDNGVCVLIESEGQHVSIQFCVNLLVSKLWSPEIFGSDGNLSTTKVEKFGILEFSNLAFDEGDTTVDKLDILDASNELAPLLASAVIGDVLTPLNWEEIDNILPGNSSGSVTAWSLTTAYKIKKVEFVDPFENIGANLVRKGAAKNNFRYCALEDMFDVLEDRGNKVAINFVILGFDKGFEKAAWEFSFDVP